MARSGSSTDLMEVFLLSGLAMIEIDQSRIRPGRCITAHRTSTNIPLAVATLENQVRNRRQGTKKGLRPEQAGSTGRGKGQRTEDRGQRTEDRGQRVGGRGQRAEGRRKRAEGRGQRVGRTRLLDRHSREHSWSSIAGSMFCPGVYSIDSPH